MEVIGFLRKQGYRGSCFDKKKNTKSNPVLSVQKGTTNNVSNLSELIIVLPAVEMTLICKKKRGMSPKMCSSAIRQQFLNISEDTAFQKVIVHFMNFEFWREFSCCLNGVVHSLIDSVNTKLFVFQMRDIFLSLVLLMS